ncbi:MAG: hypothetical protein NTX11_03500 [Candidatus Saccharibacteria bacterium]|nr:hypothetical protein [Candidatus Saccharibacteria bacterium]
MTYVNEELKDLFGESDLQETKNHPKHIKRKESKVKKERSKTKIFLSVLVILFIVVPAISSAFHDQFTVAFYSGPEKVKQLADQSGMNQHGKALFYSTNPEIVDYPTIQNHCPGDSDQIIEYGCFIQTDNKIYILNIPDDRISGLMNISAAHEMLHKAYSEMDSTEKTTINSEVESMKTSNIDDKDFNDMVQPYLDNKVDVATLDNELHSLIGTEVAISDSQLEEHYSKYFTSRQNNVDAERQVRSTISEIESSLTAERTRIDGLGTQLNHTLEVTKGVKKYMDSASYNGNIYGYNLNEPIFNKDVDIYNSELSAYNSAVDSFNARLKDYQAIFTNLKSAQNISSGI